MPAKPTIVAVNGSPHAGVGSTALIIEMLRPTLAEKGFDLEAMPLGFKAEAAGDMKTVIQFEVIGEESFLSHLRISDGRCTYQDGPAATPNLVIKTPAGVWLKIARGELSGQKAFMEGLYRVEGDLNLLLKLNRLFSA